MATKTQVVDGVGHITGTLAVRSQCDYPILISAPTRHLLIGAGSIQLNIEDISTAGWSGPDPQPNPPEGTELTFAVSIYSWRGVGLDIVAHEFVYMTGLDDDDIVRAFDISISGNRIWRTESTSPGPGRESSPVFAREVSESDLWVPENPISIAVTFGSLSYSETQTWNGASWDPPYFSTISALIWACTMHKGASWIEYAEATGLTWDGGTLNFSGMSKTYGEAPPGLGGKVTGGSGSLELTYNSTGTVTSTWLHGLPLMPDFSFFSIRNRQGVLLPDLGILGPPFKADLRYPWTLTDTLPVVKDTPIVAGTPIILSVQQVRSIGQFVEVANLVTVDGGPPDYDEPGYAYGLIDVPQMSFSIWPGYA